MNIKHVFLSRFFLMFNETQNIVSRPVRVILIIVPAFLLDSSRCQHFVSQSCFIFFGGGVKNLLVSERNEHFKFLDPSLMDL